MIVVELKDGRSIEVEEGTVAAYAKAIRHVQVEEVIETCLEVRDEPYGKLLASFKAEEVVFYHIEEEPKDDS